MKYLISFRIVIVVLMFGLVVTSMTSCLKSKDCESDEQKKLNTYLQDNNISDSYKTSGGIYFIESDTGTGLTPEKDNYVYINYTGRYLDGTIHETSDITLKNEWSYAQYYTLWVYGPLKFQYGHSIAGINEGMGLMKEGSTAKLIIPSNKAFYDCNSYIYDIQLLKVIRDPITYEDSILAVYRHNNGYDTTTYYNGVYLERIQKGDSITRIVSGKTVRFTMVGKFVECYENGIIKDSRQFDSTEVILERSSTNTVTSTLKLPIPSGVITALDSLDKNSIYNVLIPYTKAFGTAGYKSPTYGYIIVPAYQTVLYTLKISDITETQAK